MRYKRMIAVLLTLILVFTAAGCGQKSEEPGDAGKVTPAGLVVAETEDTITIQDEIAGTFSLNKRPERVVTLLNSVLDLWYLAGGTAVARIDGEDNVPEAAKELPSIGSAGSPSVEKIVSFAPDLVILVRTMEKSREIYPALRQAGIPVLFVEYKDYDDFLGLLAFFTRLTGKTEQALAAQEIDARVQSVIELVSGLPSPRTFILYATGEYWKAAVTDSVAGDLAARMGAINLIDQTAANGQSMVDFSTEAVVRQNPEVILIQTARGGTAVEQAALKQIRESPVWQQTDAVKSGRVYAIPRAYSTLKPNAAYPEAFQWMKDHLYESN